MILMQNNPVNYKTGAKLTAPVLLRKKQMQDLTGITEPETHVAFSTRYPNMEYDEAWDVYCKLRRSSLFPRCKMVQ